MQDSTRAAFSPVRDDVFVFTLGGETIATSWGANCTAVIGADAVLLVDPLIAPAHARLVEAALRALTRLPVRWVVLTHHHTDHALGASWFAGRGATVLAHRVCSERMGAEHAGLVAARRARPETAELFRDAEAHRPQVTFEDEHALELGGLAVRVIHPGHQHTPGDAIVHVPSRSVVVSGDLLSARYHVNYEDAAPPNLSAGLDLLRDLAAETYVPGHGLPGGSELLDAQRLYHASARAASTESPEGAVDRLGREYPDYRLREVLPGTASAFTPRRS